LQFDVPVDCRSVTVVVPQGRKYQVNHQKRTPDEVKDGKACFRLRPSDKKITVLN
jgi:hypothetical protein